MFHRIATPDPHHLTQLPHPQSSMFEVSMIAYSLRRILSFSLQLLTPVLYFPERKVKWDFLKMTAKFKTLSYGDKQS